MAFDKEAYWKQRAESKRGHVHKRSVSRTSRIKYIGKGAQLESDKPLGKYAIRKNTKRARKYSRRSLED